MLFQYNSCEDKDIYGMVKNCNYRRDTISLIYLALDEGYEKGELLPVEARNLNSPMLLNAFSLTKIYFPSLKNINPKQLLP